ncbi:helix-turn-helix transcriptional regulator [Limosilactobacillus reuteri]|uniref:Helix-turn-helix transcriptional regulator n=1 Tax=Limosilactobacillus reuteri TaxID=1598 RepID=A0AAW6JD94_LIMRT|nr:helix-turn-helix transcriptional regulator [Limosilactobacillus reuteri]MDD1381864.1 helix-turn-helix transcriptional regulator [Limosilactobacillus reuteri]MDD1398550.1 helix-turn-helix transcriptional regulator [Limosilactobacillus reuteri]MDD1405294.1 helix-turn-helix transcriptional regulator [Limosilactobacillus reuteri]
MSKIGVNISQRRKRLNMTQEELSNRADISTNYVSRLERGEIDHIRAETLFNIAKGLNTTMEDLIDDSINKDHVFGYYQTKLINTLGDIDNDKAEELAKSILNLLSSDIKINKTSK